MAGMSAGVLGLTGLSGFIFYIAASIFLSVSLVKLNGLKFPKTNFSVKFLKLKLYIF